MINLKIPPPIQTGFFALLMWLSHYIAPFKLLSQQVALTLAFVCVVFAISMLSGSLLDFIRQKTTVNPLKPENATQLVVSGMYKYSRNPMYLGMAALLAAWMLWLANPINIIWLAGFVAFITRFQIKQEEVALIKIFKADYRRYCSEVKRWWGRY